MLASLTDEPKAIGISTAKTRSTPRHHNYINNTYVERFCRMRCANSLMLWCLQKMQEYWWYVEAFCKRPERKELVQIAGENRSI
jgi:hypothetical protein